MSRIVASSVASYDSDSVKIVGRVYAPVNGMSTHRVIVRIYMDGQIRATLRDYCQGLYCSRKTMLEQMVSLHGNY
jgi:hypothetical protein